MVSAPQGAPKESGEESAPGSISRKHRGAQCAGQRCSRLSCVHGSLGHLSALLLPVLRVGSPFQAPKKSAGCPQPGQGPASPRASLALLYPCP